VKDSFYEEEERVFSIFPAHTMNILLQEFNAKVGREDILNRQFGLKVYTKLVMIVELG
jgi:hypothetical protein